VQLNFHNYPLSHSRKAQREHCIKLVPCRCKDTRVHLKMGILKKFSQFFWPVFLCPATVIRNKYEKVQANRNISRGSTQQSDDHIFQKYDLFVLTINLIPSMLQNVYQSQKEVVNLHADSLSEVLHGFNFLLQDLLLRSCFSSCAFQRLE